MVHGGDLMVHDGAWGKGDLMVCVCEGGGVDGGVQLHTGL